MHIQRLERRGGIARRSMVPKRRSTTASIAGAVRAIWFEKFEALTGKPELSARLSTVPTFDPLGVTG